MLTIKVTFMFAAISTKIKHYTAQRKYMMRWKQAGTTYYGFQCIAWLKDPSCTWCICFFCCCPFSFIQTRLLSSPPQLKHIYYHQNYFSDHHFVMIQDWCPICGGCRGYTDIKTRRYRCSPHIAEQTGLLSFESVATWYLVAAATSTSLHFWSQQLSQE